MPLLMGRLAGWKKLYLSKGGKGHSQQKHIIFPSQVCHVTCQYANSYGKQDGKTPKRFSVGGTGDAFKFNLVDQDMAYSPLKKGDLGIHKLSTFNQAISGKWL